MSEEINLAYERVRRGLVGDLALSAEQTDAVIGLCGIIREASCSLAIDECVKVVRQALKSSPVTAARVIARLDALKDAKT